MKFTAEVNGALIWFGAGISVAEIITGTYFAPLGLSRAVAAIILGHVIGCALLFLAGYIGSATQKSAMQTTQMSFGVWGSRFFALLNVLQLVGWTGIMIYDGAASVNQIAQCPSWLWPVVIGVLIAVWLLAGITNIAKLNVVSLTLLFLLTLVLCRLIFFGKGGALTGAAGDAMSFGAAVELAVAMPLSWLPLVSDYTKESRHPFRISLVSAVVYGVASCWMYVIGLGTALFTQQSDIALIMASSGLGWAALLIVVLSTVTTTFLDALSAGISFQTIWHKANAKAVSLLVTALGVVGAALLPMDDITPFLYLIGSVFAPMIAVQVADYFLLRCTTEDRRLDILRAILWVLGFALYRASLGWDLACGNTLPVMLIVAVATVIVGKLQQHCEGSAR